MAQPGCPDNNTLCTNPADIGRFGSATPNLLEGPGLTDFDLFLMKDFHMTDRIALQFRATTSNGFNHPNFAAPRSDISAPGSYGVITGKAFDLYGQPWRFIDFMMQ